MTNREDRFIWNEGDFEVSTEVVLPQNLVDIVENAPASSTAIGKYLLDLIARAVITTTEADFLLDSRVLQ